MAALLNFTRLIERRLGTSGLALVAAVLFFISVTSAIAVSGCTTGTALPTTTTLVPAASTTTAAPAVSTTAATPGASSTTAAPATRNGMDGYAAVNFSVTPVGNPERKFCGLLAASAGQQATGLMNHSDIGGYDGMIFPFANDTTAAFYMANVPVALSVAWFDRNGKFVSSTDMEPCKTEAAKCPLYKPGGPYRTAIETLKGGLGNLGIGSGSNLSVGAAGPC